jgi:hypothetical protein
MPRPLRLTLVVVGLALAIYGTASLTGGWMGMPPWWDRITGEVSFETGVHIRADGKEEWFCEKRARDFPPEHVPHDLDPYWGGGVVVLGLGLAALGAWPLRRRVARAGGDA